MSCQCDAVSRRRRVKRCRVNTTSSRDSVVSRRHRVITASFQDGGVSTRSRVNTTSCQYDVVPKRCRVNTTPCQSGVVSIRRRDTTLSSQNDVVPTRTRINTASCQGRHLVNTASCQKGVVSGRRNVLIFCHMNNMSWHNDVVSARCRVKRRRVITVCQMVLCQHDVLSRRCLVSTMSCQHDAV